MVKLLAWRDRSLSNVRSDKLKSTGGSRSREEQEDRRIAAARVGLAYHVPQTQSISDRKCQFLPKRASLVSKRGRPVSLRSSRLPLLVAKADVPDRQGSQRFFRCPCAPEKLTAGGPGLSGVVLLGSQDLKPSTVCVLAQMDLSGPVVNLGAPLPAVQRSLRRSLGNLKTDPDLGSMPLPI